MLMQDLYKVLSNDTYITIVSDKAKSEVFLPLYNGMLNDIPVTLLDTQIYNILATDLKQLFITVA